MDDSQVQIGATHLITGCGPEKNINDKSQQDY